MKITIWNVNGIRAAMRKGFTNWANLHQADVLCLQEVKAQMEQVPNHDRDLPGYDMFWNSGKKPGYSGVVTYTKIPPIKVTYGLGEDRFDDEGRVVLTVFENFHLFNIYFPNGQRGQERVDFKLEFYDLLLSHCDQLHKEGKAVILGGDFNTAHAEIDLANPKENSNTSGFLPEERAKIDLYLEHGFQDIYRLLYPEKVEYTWWTYRFAARRRNIGWRIDYFLVSESLVGSIKSVSVQGELEGSDHCPVTMEIDL
jgi:exodeoxyribonuclease III